MKIEVLFSHGVSFPLLFVLLLSILHAFVLIDGVSNTLVLPYLLLFCNMILCFKSSSSFVKKLFQRRNTNALVEYLDLTCDFDLKKGFL